MKAFTKILLTITIILILPTSIYYGLRILNTPFLLEHLNRSYVITLPNKVWFEIDGSKDQLDEEMIFENNTPILEKTGLDVGLQYPTYKAITKNNIAEKILTGTRVGDTIIIKQDISILDNSYHTYSTYIYFSQYGTFENNTYIQEGCNVKIESENGDLSYNPKYAIVNITYEILNNKVEDYIIFEISCK